MSLLLDALKKAAEKNAQQEPSSLASEKAKTPDDLASTDKFTAAEINHLSSQSSLNNEVDDENITGPELAKFISEQNNKELEAKSQKTSQQQLDSANLNVKNNPLDDVADIKVDKLSIDDIDTDPSLRLFTDDDPSLKLALSDEEILLTDDDVTDFLGGDELQAELDSATKYSFLDEPTDLRFEDDTFRQNTTTTSSELRLKDDDTTYSPEFTSTDGLAETTSLNSLTNDVTIGSFDKTSTDTFASDNYDRTLVKIEDDVSKVFTGLKSENTGTAMTPDFAKKVFIHKSSSLRRQNYKIYAFISFVLLLSIGVIALFEMQSQMDDIDNSLVRLKRNPVPSELRFKRKTIDEKNEAVLQGKVDTEALNLLKSLTKKRAQLESSSQQSAIDSAAESLAQKNEAEVENAITANEQIKSSNIVEDNIAEAETTKNTTNSDKIEPIVSEEKTTFNVIAKIDSSKKSVVKAKQPKKTAINIKTKRIVSKESQWLVDAYNAFEQGDIKLAAMNYERVLNKNAKNRDALLGQAAIFTTQNRGAQAISNYQAVLLENPKDSLAMASLITASSMSPIESESRLKLMLRETPNATYLQFALGNAVSAQNRWQEAQQFYFKAYEAEPTNSDYAYNLAVSLEQINKPDIAINYYTQAIKNAQNMSASFDVALIQQRIEVLSK